MLGDLGLQSEQGGDVAGHLALHLGQRQHVRQGQVGIAAQGARDHRVASGDVVPQQIGEAAGGGGAAGPAQQGHQAGAGAGIGAVAIFLGQVGGQARRADRVVGRQPHAQVADHGQHLHGVFHDDGFVGFHGHNVTAKGEVDKEHDSLAAWRCRIAAVNDKKPAEAGLSRDASDHRRTPMLSAWCGPVFRATD
jgi:hypothetical protein